MADFNQPLPTQQPDLGTLFQYMPAIAANKNALGVADLTQMDQMGETFGKIAAATATAAPMMRAQIAKRMLAPFIPEHPELENLLVTHADDLPQYFKDMSDNFYNTTSKAKAAAALAASNLAQSEARTQGLENVANIRAQGQIEAKKD